MVDKTETGLPDWLKTLILFLVAIVVTTGILLYVRDWLPEGSYPVIMFIPVAFVGIVCGVIVMLICNAIFKALSGQR